MISINHCHEVTTKSARSLDAVPQTDFGPVHEKSTKMNFIQGQQVRFNPYLTSKQYKDPSNAFRTFYALDLANQLEKKRMKF